MEKNSELYQYFENQLPSYLEKLQAMVAVNSFTRNPEGVNQLGELTAQYFEELGFTKIRIPSVTSEFGDHFVLTREGSGEKKVGLISHLDTVFPTEEERENDFVWRQAGNMIYGPGTVDIKGGTLVILMILDAMARFWPQKFDAANWVVLLNSSEETLSHDFGDICLDYLAGKNSVCLVFEGGYLNKKVFKIVHKRKGMANFRIIVRGRASHAGAAHKDGANAIVQMAKTIHAIDQLTNYEKNLTFNVGYVEGGVVSNRVPHYAEALVEMRAFEPEIFDRGLAQMMSLSGDGDVSNQNGYPCSIEIELLSVTSPWPKNERTEQLLRIWSLAAEELGYKARQEARGGLSDGNQTWHTHPTLDGLGPSGGNAHCSERSSDGTKDQEYMYLPSLIPKATLNTLAILKLLD